MLLQSQQLKQKSVNNQETKPRVDRSDLKYTEKSFDDLLKKFKDVGKNLNLSGLNSTELDKGLAKAEKELSSFQEKLQKKLATENVSNYGKSYANLAYDIQKATNEIEAYKSAIEKWHVGCYYMLQQSSANNVPYRCKHWF